MTPGKFGVRGLPTLLIFVNGKLLLELPGYTTGYQRVSIPESARSAFKKGANVIAVTCRQTRGGSLFWSCSVG